jgi:glutamate-1-semialdehyde 2,1-aminomutase/spore coat polysaccharide biosynthesis protein SpsF
VIPFTKSAGEPWWELKSLFQQECASRGLLFMGTHNPAFALTPADCDQILRIYATVMPLCIQAVRDGAVKRSLRGPSVGPIFRKP